MTAGDDHTVGLKTDGTVVAVGDNGDGQCDVGSWSDIQQVVAGGDHTVGLKTDGTVVAVGDNDAGQCDVGSWSDIQQVAAGGYHTVGLKTDGTVVGTFIAGGHDDANQCDVGSWSDIQRVAAGGDHTIGLKTDGTVVAVGDNGDGQCNVYYWNLREIICGYNISPTSKAFNSDGGSHVVSIATGDNCSWSVSENPSWASVSPESGTGFGSVTVIIDPNSGSARSGAITIAGQTFDITQDCNDQCPSDPNKTEPGVCGCGKSDTDLDSDKIPDCKDAFPNDPVKKGDINNDLNVDMKDAILTLQIMAGLEPASDVYVQADVNGDNKIGIEEDIFILQEISTKR